MRRHLLVWAACVLASAFSRADEPDIGRMYTEGVYAYSAGKYEKAYEFFSAAVASKTFDPRVYYFRGLAHWQIGRPAEAKQDFAEGARLEAASAGSSNGVNLALARVQGKPRLAIEAARLKARTGDRLRGDERGTSDAPPGDNEPHAGKARPAPTVEGKSLAQGPSKFLDQFPKTPLPSIVLVTAGDSKDTFKTCWMLPAVAAKTVQQEVVVNGEKKSLQKQVTFYVWKPVFETVPLETSEFLDTKGKPLSAEAVQQVLLPDKLVPVLQLLPGVTQLDPLYLQIVKDDTILMRSPTLPPGHRAVPIQKGRPEGKEPLPKPSAAYRFPTSTAPSSELLVASSAKDTFWQCTMFAEQHRKEVEQVAVHGKEETTETRDVAYLVSKLVFSENRFEKNPADVQFVDTKGKALPLETVQKALSDKPIPVLVASSPEVDPVYLQIFKNETMIRVQPQPSLVLMPPPPPPKKELPLTSALSLPDYLTPERRRATLLVDASFEDGTTDRWSVASWRQNKAAAAIQSDEAKAGKKALVIRSLDADDARYVQKVAVKPSTRYLLSGWIKTKDVVIGDENGRMGANLSLDGGFEASAPVVGTNDWTYVTLVFDSAKRTEVTVCARLGFYASTAKGVAWFDDLCLVELEKAVPPK